MRMATENGWRARRIQGELSKLGIRVSLSTISRYLPRAEPDPGQHHRWMTFLRNHRDWIAGMDFFVVPTVRFKLLYVWFVLDHGRRRVLSLQRHRESHGSVGEPAAARGLSDAPIHRFLIYDNDAIFSRRDHPRDRESRSPSPAHGAPKSLAEWDGGALRGNGSPGAARPCGGSARGPPETAAPRVRRVLQRGARPHLDRRRSRGPCRPRTALGASQGDWLAPRRRPAPPIRVGRGCVMIGSRVSIRPAERADE